MDEKPTGKELIQSVPLYKQKWQISEAGIDKISRLLGLAWWERFARKIGFNNEVEEIKRQYKSFDGQRYQLLLQWSNKHRQKATYRIILKALSEIDQIDALDGVCKLLHAQSKPGRPLPSEIDKYSDNLKREYSSYKLRAIVDWPPPLNETFIKLAMIREHGIRRGEIDPKFIGDMTEGKVINVLEKKVEIRPDEIFAIEPSSGKVILVEGAPGSGKTTLCWYICQQWGKGVLFQQFSHVLMVELRDKSTQAAKCLADILPFCEGREGDCIAEQMENGVGENVLIVLEGWDQLPESLQQESMFQQLIEKKPTHCLLRQAVVLISSRSSVTADLHSCVNMRVETLGFTPDQIERYVCSSFEGEPDKAEDLLTKIRQNPRLEGNCYLPLILMLIVHLYCNDYQLPESFCAVIIELALTCLYRYRRNMLKRRGAEFNSFDELPDDIGPPFLHLCELAYNATMEERYSFSNLETENLLGLMQTVESLSRRENQTTQYFLHSSLQELCAAVHISKQPIQVQKDLIKEVFGKMKDYVLRFYSAITHWEDDSMCEVLIANSEKICGKTLHGFPELAKPEVLSQTMLPITHLAEIFPSIMMQLQEYMSSVVQDERPFDRDKLESIFNVGVLQHLTSKLFPIVEDKMMKLSDATYNPDDIDWEDIDMSNIFDQVACEQGMDENLKTVAQAILKQLKGIFTSFLKDIVPFFEEMHQNFETEEIPAEVVRDQVIQKFQQDIMKKKAIEQDPRLKMGFPISPQQQVNCSAQNVFLDGFKKLAADGTFLKSQFTANPNMRKTYMEVLNLYSRNTTTLHQQLLASLAHSEGAHNMLMLIHCIYEAQNPMLSQVFRSSLVVLGELNASDLIALQSVLSMKEHSMCTHHCNLETLHLVSAIPEHEMLRVIKVIEANSTIQTLKVNVGHYNEQLVKTALQKPTIRCFYYDWIMEDETTRTRSCKSLALCLRHNQSLQILDLSGTQILDVGAKELARVLNTTRLVEMNLTRCGIEERGMKALSTALARNVYLNVLYLNDNIISPAALKHLSISLRQNNTLKVLGIVEDPVTTDLSEEHFEEFILHLCFNSSVVCILLNGTRTHASSLQHALSLVNLTRKFKQQPQLSIDDHYPKNYIPEIYNDVVIPTNDLLLAGYPSDTEIPTKLYVCIAQSMQALKSINILIMTRNVECFLMKELPVQVWTQTFVFSLQFIREMKAVHNVSMSHILPMPKTTIVRNVSISHILPRPKTTIVRNVSMSHILPMPKTTIVINVHSRKRLCNKLMDMYTLPNIIEW